MYVWVCAWASEFNHGKNSKKFTLSSILVPNVGCDYRNLSRLKWSLTLTLESIFSGIESRAIFFFCSNLLEVISIALQLRFLSLFLFLVYVIYEWILVLCSRCNWLYNENELIAPFSFVHLQFRSCLFSLVIGYDAETIIKTKMNKFFINFPFDCCSSTAVA